MAFKFSIDRGGTFCDVFAVCPGNKIRTIKLLSEDPNYLDAPTEGIRRILEEETGAALTPDGLVDTSKIAWIRMGTTVATNALLERKGKRFALVVNKGFRDVLTIGNQARPSIFALDIRRPSNLFDEVIEVDAKIVPEQEECRISTGWPRIEGVSGSKYLVERNVNEAAVKRQLEELKRKGFDSVAVVLAHSYACPDHEIRIGRVAVALEFKHVTLSHQVIPMCRIVPRGYTACADAYLTPHVENYLTNFRKGFHNQLRDVDVLVMQSDGGLTPMNAFRGARAILSGPAGGTVGYAVTGSHYTDLPLIGFDMGGTSTDVSRFAGSYEHVVESITDGINIQAPQLDINTVAAGGGSRLFFRAGLYAVGPESAGSSPGPICYGRKDGKLTVTDANLMLGRLLPEYFPRIFGPNEDEPLNYAATHRQFKALTERINAHFGGRPLSIQEVAIGFIKVANETMCRPIRALTQGRGLDTSKHALACFGGAGGQHACSIARQLGMSTVLVHKYAGILSAYGMSLAAVVEEAQEPCGLVYEAQNIAWIKSRLDALQDGCIAKLGKQGFEQERIEIEAFLHLRFEKTDCALMCKAERANGGDFVVPSYGDFFAVFLKRYQDEFGFVLQGRQVIVDDIRIRASGKTEPPVENEIPEAKAPAVPEKHVDCWFEEEGKLSTAVYFVSKLHANHVITGPAILIDALSTILIEPGSSALVSRTGDLIITVGAANRKPLDESLDPIQLSIFSHRFMSIAEQMGRVLQRTSISTNIKERLDFSCALFGPDGGLVSNAPHIPVHLGAMQETVRYQISVRGDSLKPGDVILSNHPAAGGSHLPDLTVITPVFHAGVARPVFFVASRGHHADIGGICPGSMPPHSKRLSEEGTAFKSFLLVDGGRFCEQEVTHELTTQSCIGTRNLSDNISDLKAQIAANQKGITLVAELIEIYGLRVVQAYMAYMQQNAETAVREMLREIATQRGTATLEAEQRMDDGSPIHLKITIDELAGSAEFDFTGTGYEVYGNCNAPRAITLSAIIYCLRCMVGHDIPLNQGCLAPINVHIPRPSLLDPSDGAAVVGGNVQTSQRVVDTVFAAFGTCAASQGCMNNVTLGTPRWGYYETVAGGSGAGPTWHGTGGVHCHMTNTRITDPEILELRYPLLLDRFSLRDDQSGGRGRFRGGEGVCRELRFRAAMTLSVLTERRTLAPYGMAGGEDGKVGLNLLVKADGKRINLGAKVSIDVEPGDVFSMLTPGGGGYGREEATDGVNLGAKERDEKAFVARGSVFAYKAAQESV